MALKDCFKLIGQKERKYLQNKAQGYKSEGLSEQEANVKAANEYLKLVQGTLKDIYRQVGVGQGVPFESKWVKQIETRGATEPKVEKKYTVDVAKLQDDGTKRIREEVEGNPHKKYPSLGLFSHPSVNTDGYYSISEEESGIQVVQAKTKKEADQRLDQLVEQYGGEEAFKKVMAEQIAKIKKNQKAEEVVEGPEEKSKIREIADSSEGRIIIAKVPPVKKSDAKFEKAHQKLAELDELLRPGRVNIDEEFDKDRAQKIIIKAGEVVAAYIDAGTTRFAEMMQDIFAKYGESGVKTFLDPMKKGYGSILASAEDIENMDEINTVRAAKAEDFSTSFNIKKTETGNKYKPSGSSVNLEDIQRRGPVKTDVKPFNMVDRVKDVFKKHGVSINEGSLRRKYEGVYKQMTNGVRVQSMWDLFVASHEMTHAIDAKYKLVENIRKNASQKLQAEFSHAYENLFPDPKKSATLTERIEEGMAMVMEMYLINPNQATNQYPEIVKHLFTDGGNFHKKEMTDFIDDMVELITDYQSLKPEDQINARIKWDGSNKASGVSVQTKVLHALTNDLITANMVDNMMGGELRAKAITPNVTMLRNISAIAGNWIRKPFGMSEEPQTYVGNGNWSNKKGKYRVDDLLKKLEGVDDIIKFSDWLVARRQYFDFIKLDSIAEDINQGNVKRQEEYDSLKQILDRNKMPLDLVEAVYYKFEAKYDVAANIYDSINNDMIDFMESTELISSAKANEFRQSPGYASFQRFIDDEQSNTDNLNLSPGSKARLGQLKARSGSSLQILPPVYSQMVAIGETLRKGQLNLVWKAWSDAAKENPEVAKMFEPVVKQDMKNPNDFQVVYEKGVEKWYKLSEESRMFAHALSPDQIDLLNAFLRGASRIFQASTTQLFAPFAAMNITIDASTRFMQTKTGLIPFIHDIPTVGKAMAGMAHWMGLIDQKSPNEVEQYMSLGGRKQTLAGTLELEPLGSVEAILNKDWIHQAKRGFEKAVKIVELPVNFTEIIGRATEFKRALAKGYPTNVAMHMAANVGINFSNKGSLANNYVKSVAYMGAGIQAFSQFIKTAKNNPGRTGMAIGIMATLSSTGAILVYGFGDDDEKIALSNQNPEELARFIFLPGSAFGMKSGLIKIRIPEQGGNIAAAAQLYWAHHFMDNKVQFSDIYRTQETVLPSQLRFSQGLGLAGTYLPQAISPSLQTITNTRFYPHLSPIVPDWMKDLYEYAQYDKYTSRTAKAIGDITKDSYVEVSPKKVDFFIRAQGGRSVSLLMGLTEAALYGDPVKTYINIFEESDRFLFTGRVYNKFYEMREEANQELRALTSKKNDYPISNEILNEAKGRVKLFNEVHEMLSIIGDAITQGNDVPMEQRKQIFEMLQAITKEELTNNP